jgi:hypothetical protein
MRLCTKLILLIIIPVILYGCCRTMDCVQITQGQANPIALIKITYKDSVGTNHEIIKSFDGSTSSMNYNIELPHDTDWTAYFKATSSSGIRYFKTQWRFEHNDIVQYREPWQEKDFTTCPKTCWDRKLEFEGSEHGDVFGLHIYTEDFYQRNSGNGNVYVRFSEPEIEPEPDPDPEPDCTSSGELEVSLTLDPDSGLSATWMGQIPQSDFNSFCTGLSITKITLPSTANCSSSTEVCISEWLITIGEQEYTDFECDESSGDCVLDLSEPIPFDIRYYITAHPPSYLPCEEPHSPCTPENTSWTQSITVTFKIE